MRIGINASFLRKQNTGIGQVSINFLKKLAELESQSQKNIHKEKMEFFLYLEKDEYLDFLETEGLFRDTFQKRIFLPPYKRDDILRKIWWEKYLLPEKVKEDKCDVFLSLYQSATVFKKSNVKHIMVVHDIIPKLFPEYLNNFRKKMYQKFMEEAVKKTDKIIAISHRTEKDLIQHFGIDAKKITVSYIDADKIYKQNFSETKSQKVLAKYGLEPGYIYCGGGLEVRKNVESVMRAYKILVEQAGRLGKLPKLVISGKLMPNLAPLVTDVEQLAEGLELKEHMAILDYIPQEDSPVLYKNAIMSLFPSVYEGFGLPVLEAMNQGTPVITAKTSSLPEVGVDAVLYCDPKDINDLAMVMRNLLSNNHLRMSLSMKGKERATHFSWDKFVEKFLNILEESEGGHDYLMEQEKEMDF